jgi:hypothetical protein
LLFPSSGRHAPLPLPADDPSNILLFRVKYHSRRQTEYNQLCWQTKEEQRAVQCFFRADCRRNVKSSAWVHKRDHPALADGRAALEGLQAFSHARKNLYLCSPVFRDSILFRKSSGLSVGDSRIWIYGCRQTYEQLNCFTATTQLA